MPHSPYPVPAKEVIFEEEIKKSRFITYLAHTPGVEAAKQFVEEIKEKHKDARHNCWAYVASKPEDSTHWGCSDDGEPSGTAGRPMLAQLSGSGVGEITAVVTRYFGGVKLGTGGLVKAYGGGVKQALELLQTVEKIPLETFHIQCSYDHVSLVEHLCQEYSAEIMDRQYTDSILVVVSVDSRQSDNLQQQLVNKSSGAVVCSKPD